MKFKKLGNSDLKVSSICLGTMTWGEQNTQKDAFEQMDYSTDNDINFFDTAELYSVPTKANTYTKTETMIGNWFNERKNRDKIVLATKVAGPGLSWIRGGGNQFNYKNITEALEGSLKRLKTDYIDIYQLHWPERSTNFFSKLGYAHNENESSWTSFEDILATAQKFIDQGKIRYLGLSNETPYGLSKFLHLSSIKKFPRVVSIQNPYSLINRTFEVGLAEISIREKVGLLAYSPLAFGMLSGKYLNGQMPDGSRLKLFSKNFPRYQGTRSQLAVEEYNKVAEKHGISLTQMSLAFVNKQPFVDSNIIGATKMDQLEENINSINLELSEEIIKEINEIHENNPSPAP
tara:strand:- start:664 stop:1704 length:1041 start_codon:yes stop_codon:yes gene_type:complete